QFQSKKKQSELWRLQMSQKSKLLLLQFQEHTKMYSAHNNSLSRLESQHNSFLSFLSQNAQKFSEQDILEVGRPFVHLNSEMYERVFLLLAVDSLAKRKHEILADYKRDMQNKVTFDYIQIV